MALTPAVPGQGGSPLGHQSGLAPRRPSRSLQGPAPVWGPTLSPAWWGSLIQLPPVVQHGKHKPGLQHPTHIPLIPAAAFKPSFAPSSAVQPTGCPGSLPGPRQPCLQDQALICPKPCAHCAGLARGRSSIGAGGGGWRVPPWLPAPLPALTHASPAAPCSLAGSPATN